MAQLQVVAPGARASDDTPSSAERSDDDLMLLARGGVLSAFDTLMRRHQRVALAVAHRHAGDLQVADDIVQEAFVEVYRAAQRYRPENKFRAFLLRIVIQRARMARRKNRRSRLVLGPLPETSVAPLGEAQVLATERQREVQRAVDSLPERQRAVVALRFGADLSHAELAQTLRIPEGTARSRLFTALRTLRKKLGGLGHE